MLNNMSIEQVVFDFCQGHLFYVETFSGTVISIFIPPKKDIFPLLRDIREGDETGN